MMNVIGKKGEAHWDYRLVAFRQDSEIEPVYFEMCEVFYSNKGTVAYSKTDVSSDKPEDIPWILDEMKKALDKDILDGDNWPNIY